MVAEHPYVCAVQAGGCTVNRGGYIPVMAMGKLVT